MLNILQHYRMVLLIIILYIHEVLKNPIIEFCKNLVNIEYDNEETHSLMLRDIKVPRY